jgi:glutathione S-transferase
MDLTLISHELCPYVQRAAIVLLEKGVPFARRWVDLAAKPDWFTALSPLGKTPVLLVDQVPLFESAVICEYLDETIAPRLHPADPLARARHRAWMEFGSALLATIAGCYTAPDAASLDRHAQLLEARMQQLESVLSGAGPWFDGENFAMVDAVYAPVFRYFDAFERIETLGEAGVFGRWPRVQRWREALAARPSVRAAVRPDYPERLLAFLASRGSELSRRMAAHAV